MKTPPSAPLRSRAERRLTYWLKLLLTVVLAALVLSGVLERHPQLSIVLAHGGGAVLALRGRLRHGPARDSLLGFRAVNGFGEAFRGGAKVVKNVTGFDLPKLICGAFGTLAVLSELTFRVYPRPSARATLMQDSSSAVYSAKRLMGRDLADIEQELI